MPAASALARLLPTAVGGALGSSGTYLLTLAWPQAWGGPLRSALAAGVIGALVAGIAVGLPAGRTGHSARSMLRALLLGAGAAATGLGLLVTPGVMETTAWRGVTYLAVTAIATATVFVVGLWIGSRITDSDRRGSDELHSAPTGPVRITGPGRNGSPTDSLRSEWTDPAGPDAATGPVRRVARPVPLRPDRSPRPDTR
ncbi:CrcB family protein [Millisia brevis]|uniref:CrcB family protein n=1 Tax=Millisia brevis TaxID=264148 RepID=UPI00082B9715|nr:CrcB family protein [Millisia brevis]